MIDNLVIEGTNKTPVVKFFASTGAMEISGKSIPENSFGFYQPLLQWIDNYAAQSARNTEVKIQLEYFNTSSSKCLLDIFRKLATIKNTGNSVVSILWHYEAEDEDMLEAGEDYDALVDIDFKFIKV